MAVIAISQQVGSRGIELGRLTAEQLGWRFKTGQELIAEAARRFGVSEDQLLVFDLRTPHFWERLRSESHRYLAYNAALLAHPKIRDAQISVACRAGTVQLSGTGLVAPWDQLVCGVARTIDGVTAVEVGAEQPPMPYPTA
jgi:hypothetical protein